MKSKMQAKHIDYQTIHQIKELMRLSKLTLDDLSSYVPRHRDAGQGILELAGAWKHTDIDATTYQDTIRASLTSHS